jgi:uncharacterized protein YecT (DUF1311 family)
MRLLLTIIGAAVAAAAGTAAAGQPGRAPSFDCARSATQIERMVCGDERLAALDRALAEVFRRASSRGRGDRVRRAQRAWMSQARDRCADAECLSFAYQSRVLELMVSEGPLFPQLERPRGEGRGRIQIHPLGGGWYLFGINATWSGGIPGNVSTGDQAGVFRLVAGRARFQNEGCRIDFARRGEADWQLSDNGSCGGNNVTMAGRYRLRPVR